MTMDRTVPYGGGGHCPVGKPPAQVPIGWQRKIHRGGVVYISPSGSVLACLEQAKSYLQTDGTCKCGLECPLILHKVFNFDPGAVVAQRTAEDVKADSAVTKLCIHKRKIIAVATLHRSVEAQLDGVSSYKLPLTGPQHYAHKHQLGSPPQRDAYAHQSRLRPGAGDHNTQRALSPGHVNGERFGPLSPPSVMVHGPPSSSQLSCALAGRTSVSSSPSMNTKSPNRQRSPCGFPQSTDYPHKSPSSANTQQQHPIPQHTPYVVQKRQPYVDACGGLEPQYLCGSGVPLSEGRSGRAALRDKLMSQQRGAMRKRKTPGKACFRDSVSRKAQNGSQRRRQQKRQPKDSSGQLPVPAVDFLQCPESLSCSDSNHHPRSPGSMNGLLRTFKVSLAERIPHPASMVTDQSQGVGLPDAMCFQASQQEFAMAHDGRHRTEANPTGQQVRAGSRGESASSVIVRNRAFPVSQGAPLLELSQSVIHVPPHSYPEEPARHLARARQTPAKLKQVNGLSSAPDASLHLGHAMQVGQWSANGNGGPQHRLCQDERGVLQARAQDVNGNGVYAEFLARHAFPTPQEQSPAQLNGNHHRNGLLSQVRSGGHTSGSVIQSPEHYPASDGRRAYFPKRSDGYLNGQLNGNYGGREERSLNGSFVLNIAEERLGAISLHHPGRLLAHRQPTLPGGDLLWPGAPSFHPWQSKIKIEGPAYLCSVGRACEIPPSPEG
ncbi:hypothetical protein CRUP_037739 [Coryphaenoides rupestris]|nr:hypothetical protein CRUP_037739 [Coryphaenoides rupestris]